MNEIRGVLATVVVAAVLVACGSTALAPTDAGKHDAVAADHPGTMDTGVGCTPGRDQTCNDDPTSETNRGVCLSDGTCQCEWPCMNPTTGRCLNPTCACGALCLP